LDVKEREDGDGRNAFPHGDRMKQNIRSQKQYVREEMGIMEINTIIKQWKERTMKRADRQ
jgi:hypothetical protein